MCDPVSAGMFAINAAGQVAQHNAAKRAVDQKNRALLSQFDANNENYLVETMMNNNVWKNDVIVNEYEQEQMIMAMTDQWAQYDEQLDQLFADTSFKEQDSLIEMYKNSYAGEGTGVTAARLASESYREHGYKVAEETAKLVLNMDDIQLRKESIQREGASKIDAIFEKVRHPPVPGQTPIPPQLLAKPSNASLFLGLAASAVSAVGFSKLTGPKPSGMKPVTAIDSSALSQANVGQLVGSQQISLNTFNPMGKEITRGTWINPNRFQSNIDTFSSPFSA